MSESCKLLASGQEQKDRRNCIAARLVPLAIAASRPDRLKGTDTLFSCYNNIIIFDCFVTVLHYADACDAASRSDLASLVLSSCFNLDEIR